MKKRFTLFLLVAALISICLIYWKIATDEVFYLCGNFSTGVTKSSVIRQLDTANLSHYENITSKSGSMIIFSSKLYFVASQCIIEFDKNESVVITRYK